MSQSANPNVAIVTTSTTSIDFVPNLDEYPISVLRYRIEIDGEMFLDGVTERADTLLHRLYKNVSEGATTSPPPDEEILATLSELKAKGHSSVLVLTIAKTMTQAYDIVGEVAGNVPGLNVTMYDTETFGFPAALMGLKAAQMAKRGETVEQIVKVLDRMKYDVEIFMCLNDMNYLYGHSYVGLNQLLANKLLQIKPIISFKQNKFHVIDKVRHFDNAMERLAEIVSERTKNPGLQPIGLLMANVKAYTEFSKLLPEQPKLEYPISPIIAAHLGVDGVALAFAGKMTKYG